MNRNDLRTSTSKRFDRKSLVNQTVQTMRLQRKLMATTIVVRNKNGRWSSMANGKFHCYPITTSNHMIWTSVSSSRTRTHHSRKRVIIKEPFISNGYPMLSDHGITTATEVQTIDHIIVYGILVLLAKWRAGNCDDSPSTVYYENMAVMFSASASLLSVL